MVMDNPTESVAAAVGDNALRTSVSKAVTKALPSLVCPNIANEGGGAVHFISPINPVISTGSKFTSNTAQISNGGAVDAHNTNWTSFNDQFNSNIATSLVVEQNAYVH